MLRQKEAKPFQASPLFGAAQHLAADGARIVRANGNRSCVSLPRIFGLELACHALGSWKADFCASVGSVNHRVIRHRFSRSDISADGFDQIFIRDWFRENLASADSDQCLAIRLSSSDQALCPLFPSTSD